MGSLWPRQRSSAERRRQGDNPAMQIDDIECAVIGAGHDWALADLAQGLSDPSEIAMARGILRGRDRSRADLPRDLRPLTVLHGLARRKQGASSLLNGPIDGLVAIRLGLFGF